MSYSIASGCSYTDPKYESSCHQFKIDWSVWPDYLNIDINVARSGISNDMIIDNVYDVISKKGNPSSIHLLLTTWDRFTIYKHNVIPASYIITPYEEMPEAIKKQFKEKYKVIDFALKGTTIDQILDYNLRKIFFLIKYCNSNNIDLTIAQGCSIWGYAVNVNSDYLTVDKGLGYFPKVLKTMMNNQYFKLIDDLADKKQFNDVGWPFVSELGGECYEDIRSEDSYISDFDTHPNAIGQKHIAEWISR